MKEDKKMIVGNKFSSEAGLGLPMTRTIGYKGGTGYIPFTGNSQRYNADNLYPQQLATIAYNSPTHGGALSIKQIMTYGQGFNISLLDPKLADISDSINDDGKSLNDILTEVSADYAFFNGFALKVVWSNEGLITQIYHVPFTEVRCGKMNEYGKITYYKVSNNWDKGMPYNQEFCYDIPSFNPTHFKDGIVQDEYGIPTPNEDQVNNAEQLIYYFGKAKPVASSGMNFYPIPDYIGGLDSALTEYIIGVANKSKIDNGIGSKYHIAFPFLTTSDEEKKEIDGNFKFNFAGASNDGAIITTYHNGSENLPTINKLDSIDADTYIALEQSVKRNIITSHNIPSILIQVNEGGGFNNRAEEMKAAYNIFQKTVIKNYQNTIVTMFKTVFNWMGFKNQDLQIIPFSMEDNANAEQGDTSLTNN